MKGPGNVDIGTVFCFDCLMKCRGKCSSTKLLSLNSDKLDAASEKVM